MLLCMFWIIYLGIKSEEEAISLSKEMAARYLVEKSTKNDLNMLDTNWLLL